MAALCEANTTFALEMYKKITEENKVCNIFFSPLSMSSSLSMVLLGAKDATAAQMSKALQLDKSEDVHSQYQELITAINNPSAVGTLMMANRLFGEQTYNFLQTETKPVQMMSQKGEFNMAFIPDMQIKILELPYANKEKKMLIILPLDINDNTNGLELVEKNLSYQNLVEWTKPSMMYKMEIMVQIPKFKLEDSYDLKPKLISMGMVDAFSPGQANFSGMSDRNYLFLSEVVHKAFVEVNEVGTEAAAATADVTTSCLLQREEFIADHPFIFTILDCKTSTIIFLGRFCSP
ncbi:leukocyte elastase inhibitor A-like [Protopterus annectens]|uniref:leukocyte elastase inhibitor A-like n=1 Tax=Protopterus annectens TaxID=7888 RepID=UPI001CFB540F|nr:leukocyte elastase inhibitor A-like [Protopterus annectens]